MMDQNVQRVGQDAQAVLMELAILQSAMHVLPMPLLAKVHVFAIMAIIQMEMEDVQSVQVHVLLVLQH